MTTNLSNLTGATTFYDLSLFVAQETQNVFFLLFIILLFIVLVLALKRYDTMDGIWVSSLICFVLSLLLAYMKLLAMIVVFPFLFIFIITGFWVFISRR